MNARVRTLELEQALAELLPDRFRIEPEPCTYMGVGGYLVIIWRPGHGHKNRRAIIVRVMSDYYWVRDRIEGILGTEHVKRTLPEAIEQMKSLVGRALLDHIR